MATSETDSFSPAVHPLMCNIGRPRTILDVGGKLGQAAVVAKQRGADITAVDASKVDDLASAAGGRSFDLIVFHDALERAKDPVAALARAAALLTDGGHVLVDMPAAKNGGASMHKGDAIKRIEDAGLEAMRVGDDAAPTTLERVRRAAVSIVVPGDIVPPKVIVARKSPTIGKLSLTVGMLTLNEKESVEKMIDEIRQYAPDAKILLIDSSSDDTPDRARAKGARVVRQLPARGHAPAMQRLMYEAANESDALVYLDCDFTYPTEYIPRIRELLESGADVVNGSRTHHYPKAMPMTHFIANRVFAATAQVVHGVPTSDVHSGMRGYRSSVMRAFDFSGDGDALPLDTLILPARSNYRVVEIPIPYAERVGASKLARVRGTVWTFKKIVGAIGEGVRVQRGVRYTHVEE